MNNLILQNVGDFNQRELQHSPKRKRCRHSFVPEATSNTNTFVSSKRIGPESMTFHENELKEFMFDDCSKYTFVWTLLRISSIPQSIPSWTGFYIEMSHNIPVLKTTVVYLDCVNAPATEMSTIYQVGRFLASLHINNDYITLKRLHSFN